MHKTGQMQCRLKGDLTAADHEHRSFLKKSPLHQLHWDTPRSADSFSPDTSCRSREPDATTTRFATTGP